MHTINLTALLCSGTVCVVPPPDFAAWIPSNWNRVSKLTVDADGHGVVHALAECLVLGLAHEHAAVVVGQDVHLQQADGDVAAKVPGLFGKVLFVLINVIRMNTNQNF